MNILLVCCTVAACVAAVASVLTAVAMRRNSRDAGFAERMDEELDILVRLEDALRDARLELRTQTQTQAAFSAAEQQRFESLVRALQQTSTQTDALRREVSQQMGQTREATEVRLEAVRASVEQQLAAIRQDNERQLEQMRQTVDEKLSRTLNDRLAASFKQVSERLEAVYKGLGDMQSIAAGVGDLKRVLGNVKTRGILGEVQLGAILSQILAPEQYVENVATKPGSTERVEFAVKLPVEAGDPILLPIDSKFPGDAYEHLREAMDVGDADAVTTARRILDTRIKSEAKDICEKYLSVPETTNFGIMFLPFEGLYAEVVNRPGLIELLSRDYHVNVAGPSTMAALLNSLQMSYQTFRLQKQTDDVLRVLSAVKAELPRYQDALRLARRQIDTAGRTVDSIITTRTNVIERKLGSIGTMEDAEEAERLLGVTSVLPEVPGDDSVEGAAVGAAATAHLDAVSSGPDVRGGVD